MKSQHDRKLLRTVFIWFDNLVRRCLGLSCNLKVNFITEVEHLQKANNVVINCTPFSSVLHKVFCLLTPWNLWCATSCLCYASIVWWNAQDGSYPSDTGKITFVDPIWFPVKLIRKYYVNDGRNSGSKAKYL